MVPDVRIAELASGLVKGAIDRLPGVRARAFDPDWSGGAVKVTLRVTIIFELAVERENLRETPFGVAPCGPFVEILGRAAQRDMTVNRGATAGNFTPRVGNLAIGGGVGDQAPIMRPRRAPRVQQIRRGLIDG